VISILVSSWRGPAKLERIVQHFRAYREQGGTGRSAL